MKILTKEYIWQEEYPNIGKTVRIWFPYEHKDQYNEVDKYLSKLTYFEGHTDESVAEYLCQNFEVNAVEVKHNRTNDGVVFYVNWP